METVSLSQRFDTDTDRIRDLILDLGPFMRGAGFDHVSVDGSHLHIENSVGLATVELDLEVVDDPEAVLAYEQRNGIFKEMVTRYDLAAVDGGSELTATTDFALDVALVGMILDATVIKRQRRKELTAQFDYLEAALRE
jgi:hypothetical protein